MTTNEKVIIEVQCFPSICYFKTIKPYQKVALEAKESFCKQTYRNRFDILSSNGVQTIIIPLIKYSNNTPYENIKIDYSEKWQKQVLKTLKTAYASSAYYEYYIPYIEEIINSKEQYLLNFNIKIIKFLKKILDQKWNIELTNSFEIEYISRDDKRDLKKKRKKLSDWDCDNKAYWQVFGKEFVSNLSILDLIFCEGPMSPKYI